jgi:hypothetical protein
MAYAGEIDSMVLQVLCDEPGPWVQSELEREFGDRVEVGDAVGRLVGRGLAIRMDGGFILTTASGRYAHAMEREGG